MDLRLYIFFSNLSYPTSILAAEPYSIPTLKEPLSKKEKNHCCSPSNKKQTPSAAAISKF
jgi:hypothetical protein